MQRIHLHPALGHFQRESKPGFPLKGPRGQVETYISGLPNKADVAVAIIAVGNRMSFLFDASAPLDAPSSEFSHSF